MRAIVLHEAGGFDRLRPEETDDPKPGPDDVVVRVRAAALNHRDLFICTGRYAGLRFPIIPGSDGVGVVHAVGSNVTTLQAGQDVVINPSLDWGDDPRVQGPNWRILGLPDNGAFAELVSVPAASAVIRPPGLNDEEVAALPLAGLTAYRAVVTRGAVRQGETVLVLGIGGGVATFALLIARHLGARVLVTSGSDDKVERALALGAARGFNYKTTDWVAGAREATEGRGPDLIIDGTGGAIFGQAIDAVRPGGRVVTYGATLGHTPEFLARRIFWKQLDVLGTTMGSPDDFQGMLSLFGAGNLHPVIDRVYGLDEAAGALRRMEAADQFGKIVLRIAPQTDSSRGLPRNSTVEAMGTQTAR